MNEFYSFLIVGALTTLIDFVGYNFFIKMGLTRIAASCCSSTIAMTFSFICNRAYVFQAHDGAILWPAIKFFIVTISSSYGLQSAVIYSLSRWPLFLEPIAVSVEHGLRISSVWIFQNEVKAAAVGCGLLWNFLGYKYLVF